MFYRALVKGGLFEIILDRSVQNMSYFSRNYHNQVCHVHIWKEASVLKTKFCFQDISVEKDCKASMNEFVDCGYISLWIYKSLDYKFWIFNKNFY